MAQPFLISKPGFPCNVTQSYKVSAYDSVAQYLSYSDTVQLTPYDTVKPPAPVIDYATVLNTNQIELFWNRSVPKVKQYELSTQNRQWELGGCRYDKI